MKHDNIDDYLNEFSYVEEVMTWWVLESIAEDYTPALFPVMVAVMIRRSICILKKLGNIIKCLLGIR